MVESDIEIDPKTKAVFDRKGYKIDKKLNAGTFGQVYRVIRTIDKSYSAVKVMDLSKVSEKFQKKFLPREISALTQISHPNIIQTYDIFKSNKKIYVFMEFAGGGDVTGYIKKNGPLDEPKACIWFRQVADALSYLHNTKFIAHRDIKIDNILLTEDQKDTKLTDFGFSKESWDDNRGEVILSDSFCGTEPYYSPEILKRVKYDPFKSDVWAMGVVLFAMLNNKFPFHFKSPIEQLKEMSDPNHLNTRYIKKFSRHCRQLIKGMLETDESKRIGIQDVLGHKWITEKGVCNHL